MDNGRVRHGCVEDGLKLENGVCSSEDVNGRRDVWSCTEASAADHLVVMVHGILGSTSNWKYGAEQFVKQLPDKIIVHCSDKNTATLSLDGVDVMGKRLAEEVPFLLGVLAFENLASLVIHLIFRRTGRHLFLVDNDGKPPLLKRMIEDSDDCYFMSALRSFKRRVTYSNVAYDNIVGWRTSSIRRNSELPKWEHCVDEKYPHVVYEECCKVYDHEKSEAVSTEDEGCDKIEEELLLGLSSVSWEKVDVSFEASSQRSAAHSVIQVKDESSHLDGADVIQHMIDHFLC